MEHKILSEFLNLDDLRTVEYLNLCSKVVTCDRYTEVHHILPKSIAPAYKNSKWNLVRLRYEDHFRAHQLLPQILISETHKSKMLCAWLFIRSTKDGHLIESPEEYSLLRQMVSDLCSGEGSSWYGKSILMKQRRNCQHS